MGSNPTLAAIAGRQSRVTHVSELGRERFALTAPPPVRTLAIAALLAIIGVALMVGSRALGLGPVVLVLGVACLRSRWRSPWPE